MNDTHAEPRPMPIQTVSRRRLLGTTAASAGALAAASIHPASAQTLKPAPVEADVAVIGAGFSGLAAARAITQAGRSVVVLEARDRVGGRVLNHDIGGGQVLEAGGQYIGPTQHRMYALAEEYGVGTYPAYGEGDGVTILDGIRHVGGFPPAVYEEYAAIVEQLQAIAAQVPVDAPWTAPNAREWDAQTLHTWLESMGASAGTMQAFDGVSDLWGNEPRDVSLLFAAFYIAAAGDPQTPGTLARLLDVHDGAQELRFLGGSQLIPIRIAEELGDSVILSAPVREIAWEGGTVRVTAEGHTVEAQRVIVAIPPALAGAIRYTPQLPTPRAQLYQRWPMGSLMKTTTIYDRPFWRDEGLSGGSMLAGRVLRSTFDNTPDTGQPGAILGFVSGTRSRGWSLRPEDQRRADVIADLVGLFGPQAGEPIDYFEQDWPSEAWSRGGPVAYFGPGVLLDYGSTMREPVGPIHWAGTETATYWMGYMEGAVQSGECAAGEVLEDLGPA